MYKLIVNVKRMINAKENTVVKSKCPICNKQFKAKTFWQKFCSSECRQVNHGLKLAKKFNKKLKYATYLFIFTTLGGIANAQPITGTASWYSTEACRYNKNTTCPTASGDSLYALERADTRFAASWSIPLHSRVKVCNPNNGKCTTVRILDRGPNKRLHRDLDLCRNSFAEIGQLRSGIMPVTYEVIK